MIGFVVGFLLVIIVNFTHNNYEKVSFQTVHQGLLNAFVVLEWQAVTEINEMVQVLFTV